MLGTRKNATGRPWVLGLSASHNGAACLLRGDEIAVAIQEERLSRVKRDRIFGGRPCLAISYCLETAGITPADLDLVVACVQGHARSVEQDVGLNPQLQLAANNVPMRAISHHLGHAAAAYGTSGFDDAAVLVVDGVGSPYQDLADDQRAVAFGDDASWEMISFYRASDCRIEPLQQQMVPKGDWLPRRPRGMPRFRTLGGMYSAAAIQIFGDAMAAGKVMALAPYGKIVYRPEEFFSVEHGRCTFHDFVPEQFEHDRRWPLEQRAYKDLACSVQNALRVAILELLSELRRRTQARRLCYTGGVALNCVINDQLWRESGFHDIYIPAASDDSGVAIGAAFWGLWALTGENTRCRTRTDGFGRRYSHEEIDAALVAMPGLRLVATTGEDVLTQTVRRLEEGQFCGWFQDRSELGPRALGRRSILADARCSTAKDHLNTRVKQRESFRPFAPAVLADQVQHWFDVHAGTESPFMLRAWDVTARVRDAIPAVVHLDGTARVQTVGSEDGAFFELLRRFHQATGVPLLLNTSFNGPDEPIVESPEDALWCALQIGLDFVVLGERLLEKNASFRSLLDLVPRLEAASYTVEIPLTKGCFDVAAPTDASFLFQIRTSWGARTQPVPGHLYPLLQVLDGQSDGWRLLEKLRGRIPSTNAERWLANALARLRHTGVVGFRAP